MLDFRHSKSYKESVATLKKIFTASLAIWLTGAVFVFCCVNVKATNVEDFSCPLSKFGKCEKSNNSSFALSETESAKFDCCGFIAKLFDKTRKAERAQKDVAAKFETDSIEFLKAYPKSYRTKLIKQSSISQSFKIRTHLKNRVLRI